jgi:hypothetical protein
MEDSSSAVSATSSITEAGSADYMEAQNNVKLFSVMLLILSSIELMTLLDMALGVPQDDPSSGGDGDTMNWTSNNWFDYIISLMGVYVGILGLQATNLKTLPLAKM